MLDTENTPGSSTLLSFHINHLTLWSHRLLRSLVIILSNQEKKIRIRGLTKDIVPFPGVRERVGKEASTQSLTRSSLLDHCNMYSACPILPKLVLLWERCHLCCSLWGTTFCLYFAWILFHILHHLTISYSFVLFPLFPGYYIIFAFLLPFPLGSLPLLVLKYVKCPRDLSLSLFSLFISPWVIPSSSHGSSDHLGQRTPKYMPLFPAHFSFIEFQAKYLTTHQMLPLSV